jgi:D-3-phosphoglycerate dehydrogenase / 2-oxoglutarate reductase
MKTVLITRRTHPSGVSLLAAETNVRELLNPTRDQLAPALPGIHGMVAGVSVAFDGEMLDHAPDLMVMARHGVGMDNVDLPAATERGIVVLYTPKAMVTAVAECAVAFMLSVAKSFKKGDIAIHENKYANRDLLGSVDLYGKTLAIIGCGRIGSRVSQMCGRGLGMKVITYDPYITDEHAAKAGAARKSTLAEVLTTADVVTLHTPLTTETRHMIGREQLAMMKKSAYLINTSRGSVVDEPALVAALQAGQIAGAGLDVFEQEPTRSDSPLFAMPNVMCTPHSSGSSQECLQRIAAMVARGILDVLHDQRPDEDCFANPEVWQQRRRVS